MCKFVINQKNIFIHILWIYLKPLDFYEVKDRLWFVYLLLFPIKN